MPVPLVWLGHEQPVNNDSIQNVMVMDRKFALLVPHASIPGNISAPFFSVGPKYADDYGRYCRSMILLPELAVEGQRKIAAGFPFPIVQGPSSEQPLNSFVSVPGELWNEYQETLFLCPINEEGSLKDDQTMHWELAALIGQAKIGHLAMAQKLSLSDSGLEAFALIYQRSMMKELIAHDFGGQRYTGACGYFIRGLNAMIDRINVARPDEVALVQRLEISGTADKP
jgi:hypothetical protein